MHFIPRQVHGRVANPLYIDVRLVAHGQVHRPDRVNQGTCSYDPTLLIIHAKIGDLS